MVLVIGLALGLIVVGIAMIACARFVTPALLSTIVYWVGVALLVVGLILLLAPVVAWLDRQLRIMLGNP